ncbi:MAG: serine/threonine-protein kinase, partial [Gemmatimonadales bacterium]
FLAEGRLLARLTHPNVVPVHDAGEADGLLYYVMEFVEGETLADRLRRGPLPRDEALRLARDLLGALAAAHRLDIVHRDVKPSNIFWRLEGSLLGDFGIARLHEPDSSDPTRTGELIGTPGYMAPEQREGQSATAATDVYAAGLVLYEACTGRRWTAYQSPDQGDWTGVPAELAAPLRKAMSPDPAARWPDAAVFATAIGAGGTRRRRAIAAGLGLVAVAIGVVIVWPGPEPPIETKRAGLTLVIPRFEVVGAPGRQGLGDSVAAELRDRLQGYPDFFITDQDPPRGDSALRVSGRITMRGEWLRFEVRGAGLTALEPVVIDTVPRSYWQGQVDNLAFQLLRSLWESPALRDLWLSGDILPDTDRGFALWLKGEQFWARSQGEEAFWAYQEAEDQDTTCLICSFRLTDVGRWIEQTHDPRHLARTRAALGQFPLRYQALIRAQDATPAARIEMLREAAGGESQFYLTWMYLGDEQLHRGALQGSLRAEAIASLEHAVRLQPRFVPGWQHLGWVAISEGDSVRAREAVSVLDRPSGQGGVATALTALLQAGYAWRFLPADSAGRRSAVLLDEGLRVFPNTVGAARMLMSMEEARGAVEVGKLLARRTGTPGALSHGLLGQLFGYAALGRLDSVQIVRDWFGRRTDDPSLPVLALELETLLRAFDPDASIRKDSILAQQLDQAIRGAGAPGELRARLIFARALLDYRNGDSGSFALARRRLDNEPRARNLRVILDAAARAGAGDTAGAFRELTSLADPGDSLTALPAANAASRLLRAEWLSRQDPARANRVLRWHEHLNISGHLTGPPQSGEVAWALGTLARWHRRTLLVADGTSSAEWCSVNRGIVRAWSGSPSPFGYRADSARRSLAEQRCAESP